MGEPSKRVAALTSRDGEARPACAPQRDRSDVTRFTRVTAAPGTRHAGGAIANSNKNQQSPRMRPSIYATVLLILSSGTPALAVCSGASVQREYREADLVLKARLVGQTDTWTDTPDVAYSRRWGSGALVTRYDLVPLQMFKGATGNRIRLFEGHDSGAFYLDPNRDYLLFLSYYPRSRRLPTEARGAVYVRYACRQSKAWNEVRARDMAEVRRLSRGHRLTKPPRRPPAAR